MCGVPGVAIIKAEPGLCLGPPLTPDFVPNISSSGLCLPAEAVCLPLASPPTISIQESPGPLVSLSTESPGPLSYTVSLALPPVREDVGGGQHPR